MNKSHAEIWDEIWRDQIYKPVIIDREITTWQQLTWKLGLESLGEFHKEAKTGKLTLECGCGRATDSVFLAKHGYKTIMLDRSYEALRHARKNFLYFNIQGAYIVGDVQELPIKDNIFDIVTSGGLIEHFRNVEIPIKEMVRILKPGGLFVAVIITKRFSVQTLGNIEWSCARFLKRFVKSQFKNIIKESIIKCPCYENSLSKKTYEEIMKRTGLVDVKITGATPFPYVALLPWMEKIYVMILKKMSWFWRWFNRSELKLTDWWGLAWYARGFKKRVS